MEAIPRKRRILEFQRADGIAILNVMTQVPGTLFGM